MQTPKLPTPEKEISGPPIRGHPTNNFQISIEPIMFKRLKAASVLPSNV